MSDEPFYIGYLPAADPVCRRMALAAGIIWIIFGFAAISLSRTPRDLGHSQFGDDIALSGIVVARPYPVLVAAPDHQHPKGRTLLLGGEGKHGAQDFADALDGRSAHLEGILIKRGDLDMALISSPDQLKPESAGHPAPQREHLGRWRLSGEICDGKCAAGAMRPGSGASHKACANLCISSGLPPVLALGRPFEGREVLILAGENGGPVPGELLDRVGILVTLEGDARRLGDAIIFQVGNSIR
ncbi:MAG: hypothetical protein U1E28_05305 [Beijerinckiaceae bacterium]